MATLLIGKTFPVVGVLNLICHTPPYYNPPPTEIASGVRDGQNSVKDRIGVLRRVGNSTISSNPSTCTA